MPDQTEPAAGSDRAQAGPPVDTSVAHSARVHDYWLGGTQNFPADRAAGDAVIAAYPGIVASVRANRAFLALSRVAADIEVEQVAEAAKRYNRMASETQRHPSHAEVARFFDGLELVPPGLVAVQEWRPDSSLQAAAKSAVWGGVARKP